MKLNFKPIFWLLGGMVAVFILSVVYQQYRTAGWLNQLSAQNLSVLEDREWKNAENVFLSVQHSVSGSLERGEMEKFIKLLEAQKNIEGLLEFSLFSRSGVVTHSSDAASLTKPLPADLSSLLSETKQTKRLTDKAFEIYQPLLITSDCIRCHTSWPKSGTGGVAMFRFSTESLRKAKVDAEAAIAKLRHNYLIEGLIGACIIVTLFFTISILVVRYKVAAPLIRAIEGLTGASSQIASTASALSTASTSVAEGASSQAASLEQTSASLEEISSMTRTNAEHAQKASALTKQARNAAESGAGEMQEMNRAMDMINKSSDNIAAIIKTIDEIAFQTNILALNAAVEAARAGEAGMGFAVVADEVRSLAQRSAKAAHETADKIAESIKNSSQAVKISAKAGKTFQEITDRIREVDELTAGIASASAEQSQAVSQVNQGVRNIEQITQTNTATAEETASAVHDLNAQVGTLEGSIDELFRLTGNSAEDRASSNAGPAKPAALNVAKAPQQFELPNPRGVKPATRQNAEFEMRH
jgi:methyl-accepting chemotaxis protein